MPPRRIALVSSSYDPYPGGVEEHSRRLAAALHALGYAVEVWTVDRGEAFGTRTVDGILVRYLPTPLPARNVRSALSFLARFPAAALRWVVAARSFRPDVLNVQCFGPNGVYAVGLRMMTGIPLVVTSHGETFADDHAVFDRSRLIPLAMRAALSRAVAVTGCSQAVLDDLERRFGDRADSAPAIVVPNGVDIAEHAGSAAPRADPPVVLAVGRLQAVKGFDLLLHAVARLLAASGDRMSFTVRIGGDGPERDYLGRLAEGLGIGREVTFLGRLDRRGVADEVARASVVVVPSRVEAFGITVLEAWRAGTAVVATNRGGPPEFVTDGQTGLLVDPTDTDALAAALGRVLGDQTLRETLGQEGRTRVAAGYAWDQVASRYEEVYRTALAHRRRACKRVKTPAPGVTGRATPARSRAGAD